MMLFSIQLLITLSSLLFDDVISKSTQQPKLPAKYHLLEIKLKFKILGEMIGLNYLAPY